MTKRRSSKFGVIPPRHGSRRAERDPLKSWKLTDEDWRNRKKRKHYTAAIEDMLDRTDTAWAPWHLVEGDSEEVGAREGPRDGDAALEAAMRAGIDPPRRESSVSGAPCARPSAPSSSGGRAARAARAYGARPASALRRRIRRGGRPAACCGHRARSTSRSPMKTITKPPAIRYSVNRPTSLAEHVRGVVLRRGRGVRRGGRQRAERAAPGRARRAAGASRSARSARRRAMRPWRPRRYYAGAPVSAHRCPRSARRRSAAAPRSAPPSPAPHAGIPQPSCSASSATGT